MQTDFQQWYWDEKSYRDERKKDASVRYSFFLFILEILLSGTGAAMLPVPLL